MCGRLDHPLVDDYRPLAVKTRTCLTVAALFATLTLPQVAAAQDEGYAWGEEGGGSTGSDFAGQGGEDPLRIQATLGGGIGVRLLRNRDYDQDFLVPPYIDLGVALYLPGNELRHGGGIAVSTILTSDTDAMAGAQWVVTPSYHLLLPLQRLAGMDQDILQIQLRFGIPIVFTHVPLDDPNVTFGGELGAAIFVKFLAGLGLYLEAQGALYGGYDFTLHPVISADAGFIMDYEVLP